MDWKDYFDLLVGWKKLPAYRLELRIDSFIGYYLCEIVSYFTEKEIIEIIPEFPIKKEQNNLSNRVDFLLISKEGPHYLVEVKTDSKSRSKRQDDCLKKAKKNRLEKLVNDINSIYKKSDEKDKYRHLIEKLKEKNIINIKDNDKLVFEFNKNKNKDLEIIYVQPSKNEKDHIIDFNEISEWIFDNKIKDKDNCEFEKELCEKLRKWKED